MILLDTNVLIYASDSSSVFHDWSRQTIAEAVSGGGAAVNAVTLAEICVGETRPETAADRIRASGIVVLDVPAIVAEVAAKAYRTYLKRRRSQSGTNAASTPLPDFFIGAHAQIMRWPIATADEGRFRTYFPNVALHTP